MVQEIEVTEVEIDGRSFWVRPVSHDVLRSGNVVATALAADFGSIGINQGPRGSTGKLVASPDSRSNRAAADSTESSLVQGPTICSPTGSPDFVNPQGTEIDGHAVSVMAKVINSQAT